MAVLITDGNERSALAAVRALGAAGIEVAVAECGSSSLAGASRYCARRIVYPSPRDDREGFLRTVFGELASGKYGVLLPMTDITMQLILSNRDSIPSSVQLPFPSQAEVNRVHDKRELLLLARRIGIESPETFLLSEGLGPEALPENLPFPVVIKPRFSLFNREGKWIRGSVRFARDRKSLLSEYSRVHGEIPYPLVQQKIEGPGCGVFLLIWEGKLKAAFCHRRIREKPPWGGVSVLSESIPRDEELIRKSFDLLKAVGWQGVAMVEYKMDLRDGRPKLMEVNSRFWGSLQLAIDAGVNFPLLLYRLAMGEEVADQAAYRVGVKSRWLFGDLDHLLIRLRHSSTPNGLPLGAPSKLKTCADFMKFFERGTRNDVWRLNDLHPAWFEFKSYASTALRNLVSKPEGQHAR